MMQVGVHGALFHVFKVGDVDEFNISHFTLLMILGKILKVVETQERAV